MDRILLVDDDVQLCKLLAERLTGEGFTIEMLHDGSSGLERARWIIPFPLGSDVAGYAWP